MYRANLPRTLEVLAEQNGFDVQRLFLVEGRPEYLRMSALTYVFGIVYERVVNAIPILRRFRILIIVQLTRHDAVDPGR